MSIEPIVIEYYSDVLCIWAWIAQRRIDELNAQSEIDIVFHHRYIDLFGATASRIHQQWADRGLFTGYRAHVSEAADQYLSTPIHDDVWQKTRPSSSANPHLVIKAVEIAAGQQPAIDFAVAVRRAFFASGLDISNLDILFELAQQDGIDLLAVKAAITSGTAIAALMADYQQAKQQAIKGSPSYVINHGRQTLYGNVGYRVLYANIHELRNRPENEASWC